MQRRVSRAFDWQAEVLSQGELLSSALGRGLPAEPTNPGGLAGRARLVAGHSGAESKPLGGAAVGVLRVQQRCRLARAFRSQSAS